MKINRAHFLTLTGIIAATGCVVETTSDDPATTTSTGGTGGGTTTTSVGGGDVGGGDVGGGTVGGGDVGGGNVGGAGGAGGGVACDDSVGTDPDCTPYDTACGTELYYYWMCVNASQYLKPKVGEDMAQCILDESAGGGDGCYMGYECLTAALAAACADATADDLCTDVEAACGDDPTVCHEWVDGLNADGRAAVAECIDTDCSYGLYNSCVEGIIPVG